MTPAILTLARKDAYTSFPAHQHERAGAEERDARDEQKQRGRHLDRTDDEPRPIGPFAEAEAQDVPLRARELRSAPPSDTTLRADRTEPRGSFESSFLSWLHRTPHIGIDNATTTSAAATTSDFACTRRACLRTWTSSAASVMASVPVSMSR